MEPQKRYVKHECPWNIEKFEYLNKKCRKEVILPMKVALDLLNFTEKVVKQK